MTHRLDTIPLPADKARCHPKACSQKMTCARYLAAIPKHGAAMQDFSLGAGVWCMAYISLQSIKDSAKIKPVAPAKDWIGNA